MSGPTHDPRITPAARRSPTGLSPPAAPRSSGLRLNARPQARPLPRSPSCSSNPHQASPAGYAARWVWAPPRSLAATGGILSSPRGTEMFQFPRLPRPAQHQTCAGVPRAGCPIRRPPDLRPPAPPRGVSPRDRVLPRPPPPRHPPCALPAESHRVSSHTSSTRRILDRRAPAGDESPRSPPTPTRADPLGRIRHDCLGPTLRSTRRVSRGSPCGLPGNAHLAIGRKVLGKIAVITFKSLRAVRADGQARTPPFRPEGRSVHGRATRRVARGALSRCCWHWGNAPRTGRSLDRRGGAAGIRTPDLRRARAALSRLSYGPPHGPATHRSVGAPGLEPGTSALSGPRSNHLSYAPQHPIRASLPMPNGVASCPPTEPGGSPHAKDGARGPLSRLHERNTTAARLHSCAAHARSPLPLAPLPAARLACARNAPGLGAQ